jgi:hypothetical protein
MAGMDGDRRSLLFREMPLWVGRFLKVPLLGVVSGLLVASCIFAPIAAALDPMGDGAFYGKALVAYQRIGVILGIPIGGLLGLLVVTIWWLKERKQDREKK